MLLESGAFDPFIPLRQEQRRFFPVEARVRSEVRSLRCSRRFEREARHAGFVRVAGIDEVGRGALVGPVVAAAVILDPGKRIPGIDDSKKLDAETRQELNDKIQQTAIAYAYGIVTAERIDQINIYQATLEAMRQAVEKLNPPADYLLVDALRIPALTQQQRALIKGDQRSVSIAAASILAKVYRDALMKSLAADFPEFQLDKNKGYGTPEHLKLLALYGPTPQHRRSFRPVSQPMFDFPFPSTDFPNEL